MIDLTVYENITIQLESLTKFATLLQSNVLTKDNICQILGLGLIQGRTVEVALFELSDTGTFVITGSFGARLGKKADHVVFPLDTKSPVGAALITGKIQWMESSQQLFDEFPESIYFPDAHSIGSLIAIPISHLGRTTSCLVLEGNPRRYDRLTAMYLQLVVAILSLKLGCNEAPSGQIQASKELLRGLPLTSRELIVQEMMHDNHSNKEISESIGYSESTIRQDAVSMFAKLNVTNRKAAGKIFIAS